MLISTLRLSLIPQPEHLAGGLIGSGSTASFFLQDIVRAIMAQHMTANINFFILNGILILVYGEIWIVTENWNTAAYHCELCSNPQ